MHFFPEIYIVVVVVLAVLGAVAAVGLVFETGR